MLVVAVFMAATVTSAQSGTGWEYDESTKTLTLSGDEVDWSGFADYKEKAESVVFDNGFSVETIGSKAFYGFSKLKQIEIPNCVKSIGDMAFYECALTSVIFSDGLQSIGKQAFCTLPQN